MNKVNQGPKSDNPTSVQPSLKKSRDSESDKLGVTPQPTPLPESAEKKLKGEQVKVTPKKNNVQTRTDEQAKTVLTDDPTIKVIKPKKANLVTPPPKSPEKRTPIVIEVKDEELDPEEKKWLYTLGLPSARETLTIVRGYAEFLSGRNRFDEAEREFNNALKLKGGERDLRTLSHFARNQHRQKNGEAAEQLFVKAEQLLSTKRNFKDDDVVFALSRYAILLQDQKKFAEAKEKCARALSLPGGQEDYYAVLCYAYCLWKLKDYEMSLKAYGSAMSINRSLWKDDGTKLQSVLDQFVKVVREYVQSLIAQEKFDEAENVLKKALEEPYREHPILLRELAQILAKQGKIEESKQLNIKAAELTRALNKVKK